MQNTAADTPGEDDCGARSDIGDSHIQYSANIKGNSNPAVSVQKKRSRKQVSEETAAIKKPKEQNEAKGNPDQVDDECEIFGKHVAVQLKILHPEHCILAQEDIQRVLTKYRLAGLSSNYSGSTPPPTSSSPHSSC